MYLIGAVLSSQDVVVVFVLFAAEQTQEHTHHQQEEADGYMSQHYPGQHGPCHGENQQSECAG